MTRICVLAVLTALTLAASKKDSGQYGATMSSSPAVPLAKALTLKPAPKKLVVKAGVEKVCKKKGCWMVLSDGDQKVRVTFKDYGFFVPQSLIGKSVKAEGALIQKTLSVDEARHYLEDEGASPKKLAAVKGPVQVPQFIATSVAVLPLR